MRLGVRKTHILRVAAVATIAATTAACSSLPTVPDWVDPTTWFGSDKPNEADNAVAPDLASVPDRPATSTPDDQQQVSEALAADRTHAKYSADALRGGTEAAAAPPPNAPVTPVAHDVAEASAPAPASNRSAPAAAPAPTQVASADRSVAQEPSGSSMPGTLPSTPSTGFAAVEPPPAAVETAELPSPAHSAAPVQTASAPEASAATTTSEPSAPAPKPKRSRQAVASLAPSQEMGSPPLGAQGVMPPTSPAPQQMASISPSDAALGFKPSTAPPLDPTISQFVAAPIIDHYRATAANAGIAHGTAPVAVASHQPSKKLRAPSRMVAEGGPEHMSGAVVANLDALTPASAPANRPAAYANPAGLPPTAVVFFPNDATRLNAEGKAQIRAAVDQFRSGGGQGYIRVVGHSSSRTANMSPDKHMEIIFRKSQERATAVAEEIIREGVPADKVLVEAVGDSQPIYYESMPKGEDGNRRAEIFVQS